MASNVFPGKAAASEAVERATKPFLKKLGDKVGDLLGGLGGGKNKVDLELPNVTNTESQTFISTRITTQGIREQGDGARTTLHHIRRISMANNGNWSCKR